MRKIFLFLFFSIGGLDLWEEDLEIEDGGCAVCAVKFRVMAQCASPKLDYLILQLSFFRQNLPAYRLSLMCHS